MPRPIVTNPGQQYMGRLTSSGASERERPATQGRISLTRRSRRYLDALGRLDIAAAHVDVDLARLHAEIEAEFHPVIDAVPVGFVSRCYLGPPYEVHHLDMFGGIVGHCAVGEPLPGGLERARLLALHPAYVLIEVYPNSLVCLRSDGTATHVEDI